MIIIFFLIFTFLHVGSSQSTDAYSAIESSTCGQLTATPEQIAHAVELFPSQRIYGGREVTFVGEWYPWAVEITAITTRIEAGQVHTTRKVCSGSILNRRWVISAAHCFFRVQRDPTFGILQNVKINLTDMEINFGMFGRPKDLLNEPLYAAKPILVVQHRQYLGPGTLTRIQFDIALVKLDHELEFTVITNTFGNRRNRFYINSICLPRDNPDFNGRIHISAGFGRIGLRPNQNRSLRMMEIPLTNYDHCWDLLNRFKPAFIYTLNDDTTWRDFVSNDNSDNPYHAEYKDRIICSSILLAKASICRGDSGGPLMVQRPSGDRWELTGINRGSIGESNMTFNKIIAEKLGKENPELANTYYELYSTIYPCGTQPHFINTHHFIDWIRDIIVQDQQQSGEQSVDYTEYAVFTMGIVSFLSIGGATVRQRIRAEREARRKEQETPPLTPSGAGPSTSSQV